MFHRLINFLLCICDLIFIFFDICNVIHCACVQWTKKQMQRLSWMRKLNSMKKRVIFCVFHKKIPRNPFCIAVFIYDGQLTLDLIYIYVFWISLVLTYFCFSLSSSCCCIYAFPFYKYYEFNY